jgi:hypothetical protein
MSIIWWRSSANRRVRCVASERDSIALFPSHIEGGIYVGA